MKIDNTKPPQEFGPCYYCKGRGGNAKWELHFTPMVLIRLYPYQSHDLTRWKKGRYMMGKPLKQKLQLSKKDERGNGTTSRTVCDACLKEYFK